MELSIVKGILNYRVVGKAKIWYINEDVNFLEMIHGNTPIIRLIRKDKNEFYSISDIKFLIIPSEIFQVLYLQALEINNLNFIRDSGKRFGIIISTTYKMYSGIERVLNEEYLKEIIKLTEKFGFGKIEDIFIDIKALDFLITLNSSIESLI